MKKLLNPYDKEYMKMAMLKHEETFKQQVYELHRLYQVQKILMKNMEINKLTTKGNNVNSQFGTFIKRVNVREDFNPPQIFPGGGESGGNNLEIIDESEIELTLGPSCYGGNLMRMNQKKKDLSPEIIDGKVDSGGRSFSSSSTGSSNNNNNVEEQLRQERLMKQKQQETWLQALTLNVT